MATFAGTTQKCNSCEKTVYFVELITDNKVYHKACFLDATTARVP
ncbi:hypothetical protein OIU77_000555 [Salix suchowensis]|uniref:LIM zinc-binding domain-containing protein n=1 Tax=Salix suchowensis TaxID=1278906 RepID=A0ABQ9B8B6_9ROSI|nr:hypothetical protein OIU77_000555 [Salix suchowensis]